jgi:hypothetical protein
MINWPNGKTFIITMAGGMATWRPTLRYQKKSYIALSNKYDKRVYKVRKLSALFGDYPFQLDDFERE